MTQRDVFLIAVDGSREIRVAASPARDVVVGWSSDGARLLFASDRSGAPGLWAVAINDGKPSKAPELIKSGVGQIGERPLGMTANGSLYFAVPVGGVDVYVESLDFSTGKALVPASRTGEKLVGFNRQPDWSPDGKFLAYVSSRAQNGRDITTLAIQSAESGALIREIRPQLTYAEFPHWTPDGRSLVAYGWDLKGGSGIYRIDAQTGSSLQIEEGDLHGPQMSPDAKKIYSTRYGEIMAIVELDIASRRERELILRNDLSTPALSPDGHLLAARSNDSSTKSSVVLLIDVDTGDARELLRVRQPQSFDGNALSWTPDGHGVLVKKTQSGRPPEVVMIPIGGGEPRKLEISAPSVPGVPIRVHPDGSQVAFTSGKSGWEISVLESFLPKTKPQP
jgi:Tol biopolymer transport system component